MLRALLVVASLVAVAAVIVPPAAANHAQGQLPTVRFDHKTGNEWWIEAIVTVDPGYRVDEVFASTDGSLWYKLKLESWGAWAASFHIPPGSNVKFRAAQTAASAETTTGWQIYSCWFSHPAGAEVDCADNGTTPFGATFTNPSGNEWWQQVHVSGNRPISGVFVSIDNGDRKPLTLRSWGAWANSYHAPSGSVVQFIATSGANESRSNCYSWPSATPVSCTQTPPPTGAPIFDHKSGNEWWVEVLVTNSTKPTRVLAQDRNQDWVELTFRSWGAWAGSFHIEPGNWVQFQAQVGERWYVSSCQFTHPAGVASTGGTTCEGELVS